MRVKERTHHMSHSLLQHITDVGLAMMSAATDWKQNSQRRDTPLQTHTWTHAHVPTWRQYCCVSMATGSPGTRCFPPSVPPSASNEANRIIVSVQLCTHESSFFLSVRVPAVEGERVQLVVCLLCTTAPVRKMWERLPPATWWFALQQYHQQQR